MSIGLVHSEEGDGSRKEPRFTREEAIEHMRAQMLGGREGAVLPSVEEVEAEILAARAEVTRLENRVHAAKKAVKELKRQIDRWKLHVSRLNWVDQLGLAQQLHSEINWRAEEINRRTPEIAQLLADLAMAQLALQMTELKKRFL